MNTRLKSYAVMTAVAVMGLVGSKAWAANTGYIDGTITVTPVANVSLNLAPTTYAFGNLDVNTSSVSAIPLVLSNTGNIAARITKQIPSDTGLWVADVSSTTPNHYILSVATSSFAPDANGLQFSNTGTVHRFGAAVANGGSNTSLRGLAGAATDVDLDAMGGAADDTSLWFRLEMPVSVTSTAGQEILVRFTGTAL
jgi:hypothetical protein